MATPDWAGMTVVCMASGPSLTSQDAEAVHRWRIDGDRRRVIVTNTTYQLAPWADVLYAMDAAWWREHRGLKFFGERLTISMSDAPGATYIHNQPSGNSGAGAITLALRRGARRVILLGYDAQYAANGKRHWHGDHPKGLSNCQSLDMFLDHFEIVRDHFPEADIVNASRETAIEFWPRVALEEVLS